MRAAKGLPSILTLLLAAGAVMAAAGRAGDLPAPTAAEQVAALMSEWDRVDSPGCAIGVIRDGELIFKRGYGQSNMDHGIPITSRTVFDIGSTSKQFTAAAVVLLAEEGKLSLDDDIRKHLPEMPEYGQRITVRHLLHPTSGIRDYLTVMLLAGLEDHDVYNLDDVVALIARQKGLNFEPGAEHLYSNSGYILLAEIVERASGRPFSDFVRERIFEPLGMRDTRVYVDPKSVIPRRATGYSREEDRIVVDHYYNFAVPGDGQVYTTVEDLARWDRVFYEGGVGGEGFVDQLQTRGVLNDGTTIDYAFGLVHGEHRGLEIVRHGGAWGGFRAEMLRFPTERTSVICLCNFGEVGAGSIARQVADIFLAGRYPAPAGAEGPDAEAPSRAEEVGLSAGDLERLAGLYFNAEAMNVRRIVVSDGALIYSRGEESRSGLEPMGGGRFRMLEVPVNVEVWFEPASGPVQRMLVRIEDQEPSRLEAVQEARYTAGQLAAFAGTYGSEELDVEYRLVAEGEALRIHIRDKTDLLEQSFADFFTGTSWPLSLKFERAGDGRVTGFTVNAGRVRDIRFARSGDDTK